MTLVMALFQKQVNCPSDKAITMCGTTDRAMRLMPVRHNRIGTFAENKLRLVPTTMCRRTLYMPDYKNEPAGIKQLLPYLIENSGLNKSFVSAFATGVRITIRYPVLQLPQSL